MWHWERKDIAENRFTGRDGEADAGQTHTESTNGSPTPSQAEAGVIGVNSIVVKPKAQAHITGVHGVVQPTVVCHTLSSH